MLHMEKNIMKSKNIDNLLSVNNDYDLTYDYWLNDQNLSVYKILYPSFDLSEDELNAFQPEDKPNPMFKPYAKIKNLNKNLDEYHTDCAKSKTAVEIGLTFEF